METQDGAASEGQKQEEKPKSEQSQAAGHSLPNLGGQHGLRRALQGPGLFNRVRRGKLLAGGSRALGERPN